MNRGIAIRRHVVIGSPAFTGTQSGARHPAVVATGPPDVAGHIQLATEAGDDLGVAASAIVVGVIRGARRVGATHLQAIGRASETVIRTTARLSGDLGVATRGLVEGAIGGAREFGFDVVDAATAAAAGAMKAAGQVSVEAGLQVRSALVKTIANLKGVLNETLEPVDDTGPRSA